MAEKTNARTALAAPRERSHGHAQTEVTPSPQPASDSLFGLQRDLGNQTVLRLFQSGLLQAKLRVSQPGDADEQEADRIAEHVGSRQRAPVVQRKCACEGGAPCAKCAGDRKEEVIHRSVAPLNSFPVSLQRAAADQAASTVAAPAQHEAGASASRHLHRPHSLLVDDEARSLEPGQMRKTEFLEQLRAAACATADAVLAAVGHSTKACPYVAKWLSFYSHSSAEHVERALLKYAPEARRARSAHEYMSIVNRHVQRATLEWAKTGNVTGLPDEIQKQLASAGGGFLARLTKFASTGVTGAVLGFFAGRSGEESPKARNVQRKAKEGSDAGTTEVADVRGQLGAGRALDSRVQSQMSSAFGYDFSGVRVHADAQGAKLSSQLDARAFAVGNDVAFAAGEYKPGTLIGDALIAHELAHVVQQGGGQASSPAKKSDSSSGHLEREADAAAVGAVTGIWGRGLQGLTNMANNAMPRLQTGLRLQRCSKAEPAPDFHAGTSLPEAGRLTAIQSELNPTSSVGGVAVAWDGAKTGAVLTPPQIAARNALKTELTQKMVDHLAANMPSINAEAAKRRLPITAFEGAGRGAKRVVDRRFGALTAAAAFTPIQTATQSSFQFKATDPGKTLFDANDKTQRSLAGIPIDADDLASWIAETDNAARAVQVAHHFNKNRSPEEGDFLQTQVLDPFVAAHKPDLEKYDLFGFAITTSKIVVPTTVESGFSDVVTTPGVPSDAERAAKWGRWKTLVHEYLHTRAHPTFTKASGGNRILIEGFTEMFTKEVLTDEIPKAPGDVDLRKAVEGGNFPAPSSAIVGGYDPGEYKDYLDNAEHLRDSAIGPGGENAVRAAFFLGHVEYLGLKPAGGAALPATPGSSDLVKVPAGISSLAALSKAAKVSESVIQAANPGLPAVLPPEVHVPGAHEHIIVVAKDVIGAPPATKAESKSQIATQHGISERDLENANPGLDWTTLVEGQHILIPKR